MGINYYAEFGRCLCCERCEKIHIGKQSKGWRFAIHIHPEYYKSSDEMYKFLDKKDVNIFDEYENLIELIDLFKMIEDNKCQKSFFAEFPEYIYAEDEFADLQLREFS